MVSTLFLLSLLTTAIQSGGTHASIASQTGCITESKYHQLDFWIGDWDTFEADTLGPSEARTHVDPIAQGCALHELYEQSDGLIGDSILSFDPVRNEWQQTWVTNRGSLMFLVGNFINGELVLEGEAHLKNGTSVVQRITWKKEEKGVRERAVLSKDNALSWTPAFDVLFRKHQDVSTGSTPTQSLIPEPLDEQPRKSG